MSLFNGIKWPYATMQQLNLDWILEKVRGLLDFLPSDGTAGQILRRTADGAEWSDEVGGGSVESVNGRKGAVVLGKSDVGLSNVDNIRQYSAQNPPPYPVKSVNGQTGDVTVQPATDEQVTTAVNSWLGDNVAQETGYVLDGSLSMSNAAAPADKVGYLKSAISVTKESTEELISHFIDETSVELPSPTAQAWFVDGYGMQPQDGWMAYILSVTPGEIYKVNAENYNHEADAVVLILNSEDKTLEKYAEANSRVIIIPENATEMVVNRNWRNSPEPTISICEVSVPSIRYNETQFELCDPNGHKYSLQISANGSLISVPHIPSDVLFMGNSLLLGMDANGEHGGAFGMAATSYTKDFCYLVEQEILRYNASCHFDKLHVAPFEEGDWSNYISSHASNWTGKDLVILQIGDNVNTAELAETFTEHFPDLVQSIRTLSPNARVILVGVWFGATAAHNALVAAAEKYGCIYINIADLCVSENFATEGEIITYKDGTTGTMQAAWVSHPGDAGMEKIAERIIETLNMQ